MTMIDQATAQASAVFLSPRFQLALDLAARGHAGQPRKGTDPPIPYVTHPVAVACLAAHYGGSEDAVLAALIHDLPEDTPIKLDEIERVLGPRVRDIVAPLTEEKALPWVIRKRRAVEKYRIADAETRLVAGLDKLHALLGFARDPEAREPAFWTRFNAGKELQAWFYHSVAEAFAGEPFGDDMKRLAGEVFGERAPAENPCALYLQWAVALPAGPTERDIERAERAWYEARNVWLNSEATDRTAMLDMVERSIAAADADAATTAARFLGFAGREEKRADERLARILRDDQRPRVIAAALTAVEQILDDIHAESPDTASLEALAAAVASRGRDLAAQVEAMLAVVVANSAGDARFVERALTRLRDR
jgi:hypothetical protein